jgi:hypothetical protein
MHRTRFALIPTVVITAFCLLVVTGTADARKRIFTMDDPRGDAYGDGSFLFPEGEDLQEGDLDIVEFSAKRVKGGTEFEAVFARPIREPYRKAIDAAGTQLADIAKLGFYNFNIDVYVDTDREPGSGMVTMLPGRNAEVHEDFAWERVVCLTPRPEEARSLLRRILVGDARREAKSEQGRITSDDVEEIQRQVELDVAQRTSFPNRVNVLGSKIKFFVPGSEMPPAEADWAYVVVVTGADLMGGINTRALDAGFIEVPFSGLMILPVQAGGSRYTFGSSEPDTEWMPPIVDLIVPDGMDQKDILRSAAPLDDRPAQLPGVVPGDD